ncbi:MAG: N-acetylglucosamine-6-phosphate deacetylase [Frankiaceae bacterium]|nr:N-acetylglucosamine-6-phosphate deacetylase [Frankiaceae bacterium]
MLLLRGGRVLAPGGSWVDASVAVDGGLIAGVSPSHAAGPGDLDVSGCWVLPGFVDLHVHAAGGARLQGAGASLPGVAAALARGGVTSFLATTYAAPLAELHAAVTASTEPTPRGARCAGVHLEGPWLAYDYAGAQPREALADPDLQAALDLVAAGPVRVVTLAPELPGAHDLIATLVARGVRVSLGHSGTTYDGAVAAVGAGATQVTHAFNAMSPMRHRDPGLVGAAFDLPGLTVEVIADGVHVHPAAVRALWRARGADGVCLVSDCVDGCLDGDPLVRDGDVLRRADGTLAGSAATLAAAVRNAVAWGIPLADAARMASTTPARALGLDAGRIETGRPADLVVLDADLAVRHTVVGGTVVA